MGKFHGTATKEERAYDDGVRSFKKRVRDLARVSRSPYYITYQVLKKAKFVHDGKATLSAPKWMVYIDILESNLPMPANIYNPVFVFGRTDPDNPLNESAVRYERVASVGEYFTLPDFENKVNKNDPIGPFFLSSGFVKVCDSPQDADLFVKVVGEQLMIFLAELGAFMTSHRTWFDWCGLRMEGVTATQKMGVLVSTQKNK